jgi:uncharacterized protein YciW
MKIKTKLRIFNSLQRFLPIWALRKQSSIVSRAFEADLAKAKTSEERERLEYEQYFELSEYDETIQTIHTKRLLADARQLFIHVADLKWETGRWGSRYLDEESLSKLHQAVKAQKDVSRDYRIRFISALTGIIGALIGLLAIWKK